MTDLLKAFSKHYERKLGKPDNDEMGRLVEERDKSPELFAQLSESRQREINRWADRHGSKG